MTVYLNTYEVWQAFGGEEEGGWWYTCGAPVQSLKFSDDDYDEWIQQGSIEERADLLNRATLSFTEGRAPKPKDTGFGGYTFMGSSPIDYRQDDDYVSMFEDSFAEAFPSEKPYYC